MESPVEAELIRKCRAGEARFFEPLVRAYEPAALRVAAGMLGDADAARDAVQESFVKAYRNLSGFDVRRRFRPWLFGIIRNQCLDTMRSERSRRDREAAAVHEARWTADDTPSQTRRLERARASALLETALGRIAPEHREVIVLKEIEGLRYAEIADTLDIPEGTVASRLWHARRALKDALVALGAPEAQETS